jgi:hypothetical protein
LFHSICSLFLPSGFSNSHSSNYLYLLPYLLFIVDDFPTGNCERGIVNTAFIHSSFSPNSLILSFLLLILPTSYNNNLLCADEGFIPSSALLAPIFPVPFFSWFDFYPFLSLCSYYSLLIRFPLSHPFWYDIPNPSLFPLSIYPSIGLIPLPSPPLLVSYLLPLFFSLWSFELGRPSWE